MKLSVYSLKKILFQGQASLLNCKTAVGEITVLDNHESLIGVIKEGTIKIIDVNKKEHYFPVKSGFLEVKKDNQVRCIVEE
jgi:F0F1-type ATP synthase epsilon subunit